MPPYPPCHLTYLPGSKRSANPTAVWVCQYPYRTMRLEGPSGECEDCPVWRERQRARVEAAAQLALAEVRELERLVAQ
jgi:hypothetical protein